MDNQKNTSVGTELALCILFGWVGAHRFYAGKKYRFLYLLTLGVFGIGWIVDSIVLLVEYIRKRDETTAKIQSFIDNKTAAQTAQQPTISAPIQPAPVEKQKTQVKTYRVTGMSHYESAIDRLAVRNDDYDKTKKELIQDNLISQKVWRNDFFPKNTELVPEPDNPYDPKAIKVVVDGEHVGYIKAGSCAHLLKVLRENRIKKIGCEIFGGSYKYINEEYDDYGKSKYTMESDYAPYAVHLTIIES